MSIYSVVTLKLRSRSPKSNHFFAPSLWCICASSIKFQPLDKEILCTQTFYFINKDPLDSFLSVYNVVTLKIRSRPSKSTHFFPPSWWCICASLVKNQSLVKEIVCTQTYFCLFSALRKTLQRAITPRELALSPYFLLSRYILLISMCLQKLMNIYHCLFKIFGKKQRRGRIHGRTHGRTDERSNEMGFMWLFVLTIYGYATLFLCDPSHKKKMSRITLT